MRGNFDACLAAVLKHEGGFVNHPKDPGGATNFGVTQATYDAYRADKKLPRKSVRFIAKAEVADIYRTRYWDAVRGDDLPSGIDYAVFDFGVNSGPFRAVQFLQRLLGVADDGQIGPVTLAAVRKRGAASLVTALCDARLSWLKTLSTFSTFGKGWTRRVQEVREMGLRLANASVIAAPPPPDIEATKRVDPAAVTPSPVEHGDVPDSERSPAAQTWFWRFYLLAAIILFVLIWFNHQ
ncbi:MAG: glycoside hydrolase family 108 protein [bacterium]